MICQKGSGGLSVGSGDADHLRVCESSGEFYFRQNGNVLVRNLSDHRGIWRDTRAFDNNVGIKYSFFRMSSFFKFYIFADQSLAVFIFKGAHVTEEYIHPLVFTENGGSDSAFPTSEHNQFFHIRS